MIIGSYDIDLDRLVQIINEHKFSCVLIHLPDGLKYYFQTFQNHILKQCDVSISLSADSCFGACDIPCLEELKHLGIEAVFQIGHTPIPEVQSKKRSLPLFFIPAQATYEITPLLEKVKGLLIGDRIMVVTTAQHLHLLDEISTFLKDHGFIPIITKGDSRVYQPGQVLGCNFSVLRNSKTTYDSIFFMGSGLFHPIGLLLSSNKPVVIADPFTGMVQRDELKQIKEKLIKKRFTAIGLAKEALRFGILVSTKPGQQQLKKAKECKDLLTNHQKEVFMFVINHITPSALQNFPQIDCFVSTACPRIAIDDADQYNTFLITPVELSIAFGQITVENYQFDEIEPK